MIDIEMIGIGVTLLAPLYGGMWYLVILGTGNREKVTELQKDFRGLEKRFEACKVCRKAEQ